MVLLPGERPIYSRIAVGIFGVIILSGLVYLLFYMGKVGEEAPTQYYIERKLAKENEAYSKLNFDLVDPGEAPKSIRNMARLGYQVMINTRLYAKEFVGDKLDCTNCHFAGGNTTGGAGGGISLAGVAAKYPAYEARFKRVIDLPTRINNCFTRSMHGKAIPTDGELMMALVTYLHWISKNMPIYAEVPWLGLIPLKAEHIGDAVHGQRIYHKYCALCHRDDGQGGDQNPPLWGTSSFSKDAGMAQQPTLAAFIYWNMPYYDSVPVLTQEEAMDVAAFILQKPR